MQQTLRLFQRAGLTMKLNQSKFFTNTADYLGHSIKTFRQEIASHTSNSIKNLQHLRKITKLRSSLGFCYIIRRFPPSFSLVAAPLNLNLHKNQSTELGRLNIEELTAMKTLQEKLIPAPFLTLTYAKVKLYVGHRCVQRTSLMCNSTNAARLTNKNSCLPVSFFNQSRASLWRHSKRVSNNRMVSIASAIIP